LHRLVFHHSPGAPIVSLLASGSKALKPDLQTGTSIRQNFVLPTRETFVAENELLQTQRNHRSQNCASLCVLARVGPSGRHCRSVWCRGKRLHACDRGCCRTSELGCTAGRALRSPNHVERRKHGIRHSAPAGPSFNYIPRFSNDQRSIHRGMGP
jgi:hypothetical protein